MEDVPQNGSFAPSRPGIPDDETPGSCDWMQGWRGRSPSPSVGCHREPPVNDGENFESMLCVPDSKLVTTGLKDVCSRGYFLAPFALSSFSYTMTNEKGANLRM